MLVCDGMSRFKIFFQMKYKTVHINIALKIV